ncbi:ATP-dependent helicase [Candidatus Saccharibacteria bacterium]|nr:ATP-dependent helicase [Candidatus Saccharibacteria bacterium]
MPLNKFQKEAVEYLDGPLLVLAGPGTGKTQLLSSKVKYILEQTDAGPENILCVTFTESGATNMRDRLRSMIGNAANKVHIHTYHSFGSDIITAYKNYNPASMRGFESPIDAVTQYKIIADIQKSLKPFDVLKNSKIGEILSTISATKSACLSSNDLAKIADDNIEVSKKISDDADEFLKNYRKSMPFCEACEQIYIPLMEVFAKYKKAEPLAGNIECIANTLLLELNAIYETESNKEKPSVSPLTTWKNHTFELDDNGNYRLSNKVKNLRLKSFANVMQKYEEYLAKEELFDFADMIQQAIAFLKEDDGFRATLKERFQYILLDEYQDTNAAQAELISLLTDYEKPLIMAVGDDDQAIYEFQGANASNLLNFQNKYNAKVITLVENYRSNSEILDFSYNIREQIHDSFAKQNHIQKKLTAFKKSGAEISRYHFVEASSEYAWVASKIKELISKESVSPSEIAILTAQHKYVQPILPYLKSLDIDVAYEKRENIFEEKYIHELLTLAKFVHAISENQNPSHMLLEILSFPFWNIEMLDVVNTVQREYGDNKPALEYLENSTNEKIKELATFFAELVRASYTAPVELILDYLIGASEITIKSGKKIRSNFLNYYENNSGNKILDANTKYSTFELYENLNVLREAFRAHTTNISSPKLKDFVNFINDYEDANVPLISTSPYQDSDNSVQIMTAYKAKGLEFEYVFLVAVDDKAWGNAKGNNSFLSLPANVMEIHHTGITEDEKLRVFFVAATRAKSHLYITNSLTDFAGKKSIPLEYLNEHEDLETKQTISPYLPKVSQIVENSPSFSADDSNFSDVEKIRQTWVSAYQKPDGDIRKILRERLKNYKLTSTDLTSFIDIAYAGPQEFFKQKILRAPDESYSKTLSFGNLIHATLEKVTNENLPVDDAVTFFKEQAVSAGIPQEDMEEMLEKGEQSLRVSLAEFDKILKNDGARAEVNFYQEHVSLGDIPLTGKIDHINIDEKNKTIEVYDFKTSGFKDKNWGAHPTLYKYGLQLGFYKLLLNLSPTYSKYKVEKAHILFVVPDVNDGKVHDKVYEYNDKDEKELKALIPAVYQQIKTLDFVDNENLFVPPNPENKLKNIKDFIQLVLDSTAEN